jgi:transcriptional regulator with XRE-family HTH domain
VYAEGRVANPRIELLRAIAEVLEVRREWLAFDVGAMTEEEEQARRGVGQGAADAIRDPDEAGMYEEIVERFPDLKLFDPDIPALFAMHCLRRVQALAQLGVDWSDDLLFEVAEDVWDDLWSPSQTWGLRLGRRVPLGRDEMSRQIRAMVPALDATILAVFPPGTTAADLEDWEPLDPEEDDDA